jgi:hypothetical protein
VWAPGCSHRLRRPAGANGATGDRLGRGWALVARDWLYDPQIDFGERFPPRAVAPGCGRQDAPTGCDAGPGPTAPPVTGSAAGGRWRPGTGCTTRKSTCGSVSRRGRWLLVESAARLMYLRVYSFWLPSSNAPAAALPAQLKPTALPFDYFDLLKIY